MIVAHVAVTCAPDYLARREPHRAPHIERLTELRARGVLIGSGPAPDGHTADVFYRIQRPAQLAPLVDEDPYTRAGAWIGYTARAFSQFVEPWALAPVVLDGSRPVTVVEGSVTEADMAQLALVELRGAGRLVFGGTFPDGQSLALLRSADPAEARGWLADTGFWAAEGLAARPLLHVL